MEFRGNFVSAPGWSGYFPKMQHVIQVVSEVVPELAESCLEESKGAGGVLILVHGKGNLGGKFFFLRGGIQTYTHIYIYTYIYNIWRCFMISTSFQLGNVHKFYIYGIHDKNRRLQGHRIVHGKMTQPTNNLEMWRVDFIRHRIGTWTPKNWPHLFIIREVHDVKNRGVPKIGFPTCLMKIPPDREGVKRIESIQNCSNPPIM